MRPILEVMDLDSVRSFIVSGGHQYIKDYLKEKKESILEIMVTLDSTNQMFSMQGELTAVNGFLKLLKSFEDIVYGVKTEDEIESDLSGYGSDKPDVLSQPIKLV